MTAVLQPPSTPFDVRQVRRDFPILASQVNGRSLVYLDNASTSQKPVSVIEAMSRFYREENANIHRGVHRLSELATASYEAAREDLRRFLGAGSAGEIVFTRGTTEGINLVAQSYARPRLSLGDEIILSEMDHHSNIVPWQLVAEQTGAVLKVIPVDDSGDLDLAMFERQLSRRTRLVAVTHVSNALGTVNPIRRIADLTHAAGAVLVVDGAQSAAHLPVTVGELDCDFFACSGHKMLGPTGVGVLYGRAELLDSMPPYQGGGGMIATVTFDRTTYAPAPERFEAGTPNIAGVIGLGAAVRYMESVGAASARRHEDELLARATAELKVAPGVRLIGAEGTERASVVSFVIEGVHPHDVGTILDQEGIAVRGGHHCAQPLMRRYGVEATVRASFSLYNTLEEVEALRAGVLRVREVFG
jgi:cysteine desulfurase / selenocysteine lyase